jgi:hypothetical protein
MKHTPKPWEASIEASKEGVFHIRDSAGHRVAMAYTKENAFLIAAVNELLEALKEIRELIDNGMLVRDTSHDHEPGWALKQIPLVQALQKIGLAISKAEGKS